MASDDYDFENDEIDDDKADDIVDIIGADVEHVEDLLTGQTGSLRVTR